MSDAMKRLQEEVERKRKLKDTTAAVDEGGGPKKKVYLSKGQIKQLEEQQAAKGDASEAGGEDKAGALGSSPVKGGKGVVDSAVVKKMIPAAEVVRRLRCESDLPRAVEMP